MYPVVLDNGGCGVFFDTNVAGGGNRFYQTIELIASEIISSQCLVSTDQSSPSFRIIIGGSKNVVMGIVRFSATVEDQKLTQVGLKLTTGFPQSVESVSIYDGSTRVGGAVFIGNQTNTVANLTTPVYLSENSEKILTIKADMATIGSGGSDTGISGDVIKIDVDSTATNCDGQKTGTTITASGTTRMNGIQLLETVPHVSVATSSGPLMNGNNELIRVNIIADAAGSIAVNKIGFLVGQTTASVDSYTVYFANGDQSISIQPIANMTVSGGIVTVELPNNIIGAGAGAVVILTGNVTITGNQGQSGTVATQLLTFENFEWTSLVSGYRASAYGLPGFGAWSFLTK